MHLVVAKLASDAYDGKLRSGNAIQSQTQDKSVQTLFAVLLIAQAESGVIGSTLMAFGQSESDVYDGLFGVALRFI